MKAENDGVVTVTLDNTFSYMTSKTVHVSPHHPMKAAKNRKPAGQSPVQTGTHRELATLIVLINTCDLE